MSEFERPVFVVNPKSTSYPRIYRDVIVPMESEYPQAEVCTTVSPIERDNIDHIGSFLREGDRAINLGGDGGGRTLVKAIYEAGLMDKMSAAFYPGGHYNDQSATFNGKAPDPRRFLDTSAPLVDVYPLTINVDDEPTDMALLYVSLGVVAEVTKLFNEHPNIRKRLKAAGRARHALSALEITHLLVPKLREADMPTFTLDDGTVHERMSDIVAINGLVTSRYIRTNQPYMQDPSRFLSVVGDLRHPHRHSEFVAKCIANCLFGLHFALPGRETDSMKMTFSEPASLHMQRDGEPTELMEVNTVKVSKMEKPVQIVKLRKAN